MSVQPDNVVLTAMKKAEDSQSLILHAYEWAGRSSNLTLTVPPGPAGAILTNLLEQPQGSPLTITGNQLTASIHPFEILSLRVDYARKEKENGLFDNQDGTAVRSGVNSPRN